MTAKEVFEKVLSYGMQIRNDETGDYLEITDIWVNANGNVMMEVGGRND